jgi:class 3 adenylate cyclase
MEPTEGSPESQSNDPPLGERAKAALDRHEWRLAFDLLSESDTRGGLSAGDLELLAQATWWIGRLPEAIETRERAYAAALKAGDPMAAARSALLLARDNIYRNAFDTGVAWVNRAQRLLEGVPENPLHGWLELTRSQAIQGHDLDEALLHAARAGEIGERSGDRDLATFALAVGGLLRVFKGEVGEGFAALDEATVAALAGELGAEVAGNICCAAIGASASLGDWQRATQWTEAQDRWCQREHINGFPGMCRVFRAEAKRVHGAWLEAEAEARRAADELVGFIPAAVGQAEYEIGLIRLSRGDLPAAEEALGRAHAFNRDPEPGLALLRLAEGNLGAAADAIRRALEEPNEYGSHGTPHPASEVARLALLPAQVEIALAAGDVSLARATVDNQSALAERFDSLAVRASTASALGAVLLAEGDAAAAIRQLRRGLELWTELEAPYDTARTRLVLARACMAAGDHERALLEIRTARAALERLGATPDVRQADGLLTAIEPAAAGKPVAAARERAVRTFMFTDIVDSTRLAELIGDEAWRSLIRWHDQTIRTIVAEHQGEEIKTTGDGFFLAFARPDQALDAALDLQRGLAAHREAHGFAPAVRIGIHRAEADRTGLDYIGAGVNTAARIGAQATAGEVLVSASTLEDSRAPYRQIGRRTVELKGIREPVDVVSVGWR